MMVTHDAKALHKFRLECLAKADNNIHYFISRNQKSFHEIISTAIEDLKSRDADVIMESSYKLHSAASSFRRPDISNIADLLKRMIQNKVFARSDEVLESFETALLELSNLDRPSPAQEKKTLDSIHNVLRAQ